MTQHGEAKKDKISTDAEKVCDRALLCPEEWEDPAGRNVISEHHKEGLPERAVGLEADLDSFEQYWRKKGAINVRSEYHLEGAPYVEEPSEWDGHRPRLGKNSDKTIEESVRTRSESGRSVEAVGGGNGDAETRQGKSPPSGPRETRKQPTRIERPIDISALEVITYAFFRVAFGKGVRIPIKREGVVDMDITIRGKEINVNMNQMYFSLPELSVWHILYTYKGKPVLELGRGVRKGLRIHRFRALLLVYELWRGSRKTRPTGTGFRGESSKTDERGV